MTEMTINTTLDARGLICPMPLLKAKLQLNAMQEGEVLEVLTSDIGSQRDIPAFLRLTAHEMLSFEPDAELCRFLIRCRKNS